MSAPLEFDTEPASVIARRSHARHTDWLRWWLTQFSATFVAVLCVQVLNILILYILYTRTMDRYREDMRQATREVETRRQAIERDRHQLEAEAGKK